MSETAARIAMWSGPRNVSTAMMRAWENRADTAVVDEPFYAFYLERTGIDHPGAAEIIAKGETDWRRVVDSLLGPLPRGTRVLFQKQMTLHLLPEIDRGWLDAVLNCFLIRDPRDVILSYVRKRPDPSFDDLGFRQQTELYHWVRRHTTQDPPVIDARDLRDHPREVLGALCARLALPFDEAMLRWPRGPRASDGLWARWWYDAVETSTGFEPYRASAEPLPQRYEDLHRRGREAYEELAAVRLRPDGV